LFARLVAAEDATRGGKDGDAHSAEDAGNLAGADIAAEPRAADSLEAGDGAGFVDEFRLDADLLAALDGLEGGVLDVAFLFEDAGEVRS